MTDDGSGGALISTDYEVVNAGLGDLTVSSVAFADGSTGFAVADTGLVGTPIAPGGSALLTLTFDPGSGSLGDIADTLLITSDATLVPNFALEIVGTALSFSPVASLELLASNNLGGAVVPADFPAVAELFSITNDGVSPLLISGVEAGGLGLIGVPADISTSPISLALGESFVFGVDSFPSEPGLNFKPIALTTNDSVNPILHLGVLGTGLESSPVGDWGNDFIAIETPNLPGSTILREVSDDGGNFEFFLPSNEEYHLYVFDLATGMIGHGYGVTPRSGQAIDLTASLVFGTSIEPDSDFDGLPDDVELTIGTSANNPDTDGDGLTDGVEVEQGLDPFGGLAFPTGIVGSLVLTGSARDVVVEFVGTTDLAAYVATGNDGISIVDVSQFESPILLGRLGLAGTNDDVSVDAGRAIAAVTGAASGLHLVDISDPMSPSLVLSELSVGAE